MGAMWVCIEVVVLDARRFVPGSCIVLRGCGKRMLARMLPLPGVSCLSHGTAFAHRPLPWSGTTVARGVPVLLPEDQTLSLCLVRPCSDSDDVFATVPLVLDVHAFSHGVVSLCDRVSGSNIVLYASRVRGMLAPSQHRRVLPLARLPLIADACAARGVFAARDADRCVCKDPSESLFSKLLCSQHLASLACPEEEQEAPETAP